TVEDFKMLLLRHFDTPLKCEIDYEWLVSIKRKFNDIEKELENRIIANIEKKSSIFSDALHETNIYSDPGLGMEMDKKRDQGLKILPPSLRMHYHNTLFESLPTSIKKSCGLSEDLLKEIYNFEFTIDDFNDVSSTTLLGYSIRAELPMAVFIRLLERQPNPFLRQKNGNTPISLLRKMALGERGIGEIDKSSTIEKYKLLLTHVVHQLVFALNTDKKLLDNLILINKLDELTKQYVMQMNVYIAKHIADLLKQPRSLFDRVENRSFELEKLLSVLSECVNKRDYRNLLEEIQKIVNSASLGFFRTFGSQLFSITNQYIKDITLLVTGDRQFVLEQTIYKGKCENRYDHYQSLLLQLDSKDKEIKKAKSAHEAMLASQEARDIRSSSENADLKVLLVNQELKLASQDVEIANLKKDLATYKEKSAFQEEKLANNDEKFANQSEQIRQLFKMLGEVATNIPNNINERERANVSQGPNEVGQSVKEEASSAANNNAPKSTYILMAEAGFADEVQQPKNLKRAEVKSESSSPRFFSSGMQNDNHTPESLSNDKATASMSNE
ncbi:MAG: hypothetical protein M3R00_04140, partial [Pseudomonadota bacterium]|nr:hypothetical protein [Pseudomonadota bacterium]